MSTASVLDGGFVLFVLIPPAFPQTKMDVGMVLQFAKVFALSFFSNIRIFRNVLTLPLQHL